MARVCLALSINIRLQELAMNIGSLQTAAWTTIASGQPLTPRPEFRDCAEGAYRLMVPEVLETAAQLWRGSKNGKQRSPNAKKIGRAEADAQVWSGPLRGEQRPYPYNN